MRRRLGSTAQHHEVPVHHTALHSRLRRAAEEWPDRLRRIECNPALGSASLGPLRLPRRLFPVAVGRNSGSCCLPRTARRPRPAGPHRTCSIRPRHRTDRLRSTHGVCASAPPVTPAARTVTAVVAAVVRTLRQSQSPNRRQDRARVRLARETDAARTQRTAMPAGGLAAATRHRSDLGLGGARQSPLRIARRRRSASVIRLRCDQQRGARRGGRTRRAPLRSKRSSPPLAEPIPRMMLCVREFCWGLRAVRVAIDTHNGESR